MKRVCSVILSFMLLLSCTSGFAESKSVRDYVPDFFDILPWDVDTGEWKDGRDKKEDTIHEENPEKGRMEEDRKAQTKAVDKDVKSIDLVVILDKSGSMYTMRADTIGGFNSLLDEQRKKEVPVRVSVGLFNHVLEAKYDRMDIKEMKNLTNDDYVPQGSTALLDAVGNTLSALKTRAELNEKDNKVLVVIITDGMENASKEWTRDAVKKLITELQEEFGYEFVFLGADIDAVSVAKGIGIKEESSMKFKKSAAGVKGNFKAINTMMDTVSAGESVRDNLEWKRSIVEDK